MKISKKVFMLLLGGTFCTLTSFYSGGPGSDGFASRGPGPGGPHPSQRKSLRTIIIDPGHGGFDNGTHGLFSKEKDVNLAISLKLGKAIEEAFPDVKLVFTRTTDIMPGIGFDVPPGYTYHRALAAGLNYRAELANKSNGDLFICIHANSDGHAPGRYEAHRVIGHKYVKRGKKRRRVPIYESYWVKNTRTGTGSYIWKADRSGFKGSAINQRDEDGVDSTGGGENMGDSTGTAFDVSSPEAMMRASLYEKKFFANSALFATLVEEEFVKTGRHSDGVMQRDEGIRVLQATGMPSVLIETGFLTNEEEEIYLNSEDGQNEIVGNIIGALKRYKATLEGHPLTEEVDTTVHPHKTPPKVPPSTFSNPKNQQ